MMEHDEILELDYDEEFSEYTPLERPTSNVRPNNIPSIEDIQDESFEEGEVSEESDDSDSDCAPTRTKLRICQNSRGCSNDYHPVPQITKRAPNNIWANQLQETSLTDQLIKCNVRHSNLDNSRSVESYDYRQAQLLYNNLDETLESESSIADGTGADAPTAAAAAATTTTTTTTTVNHRKRQFNNRFTKRPLANNKRQPKIILELNVTEESSCEEIATDITEKLGEEKDYLILKVVELMGKRRAIQLYNKTKDIEANGGMDILNQSRRRTSGGIFLMLVKNDKHISQSIKKKIFEDDQHKKREKIKQKMKEMDFERKKSIQERLGPFNPLNISSVNTFSSRFSPISGGDDEIEDGECCDEEDKTTLSNPPPSPESD